ncbi:MAG TPA: hypothetical protein PKH75_08610 [Bacillota bacterium]|jgi:hypothetical protein|nr:hypothetical protein [Bacillota bacterium]
MPFKYVLKWHRGDDERVTVEAWNRYPGQNGGKSKAAFVIGQVTGSRALLIRDQVEKAVDTYGARKFSNTLRVEFPLDDTKAIAEAYRIGLAAAVLAHAIGNGSVQKASDYLLNITDEEVWFWTSKLLDDSVGVSKVISALCIISGTWENMQPRGQICIHLVQKDWLQLKIDS